MKAANLVEVYTASHRITGNMSPGSAGILAYLNMATESFIEVEEAAMSALHQVGQSAENCPKIWLMKSDIVAVVVESRADLGMGGGTRAGYTKPFPHWVRMLAGGYELRGLIQSGGRFDAGAVLYEGSSTFVALYNAKLSAILFPRARTESPAMAFNRSAVRAISLLPKEEVA
jgi:hypothetical protein